MNAVGRTATVVFLGVLGALIVYTLMMAFGDPLLEIATCAAWLPVYLGAHSLALRAGASAPAVPQRS